MKFRVTNWREYEAGLCRRGSLTLWGDVRSVVVVASAEADDARRSAALL
ncbi:hypothetical protein FHT85_006054 [Rhizobium sp. BK312]|nr:hypothetical protein [Rhizobium sp. BK312]